MGLTLVWLVITVSALSAQPTDQVLSFSSLIDSGVAELEAGDYDAALVNFLNGLHQATAANDPRWQSNFLFYAGLTSYRHAVQISARAKQREQLIKASDYYRRLLQIRPQSGSALNNLAQVYVKLGNYNEAAQFFKDAINVADDRQGFYALNLADLLKLQGRTADALHYARRSAALQPASLEAHQMVVDLYLQRRDNGLIDYLWQLLHRGAVNRAQRAALDVLENGDPLGHPNQLLILVTAALAHQHYDPREYGQTEAGQRLAQLRTPTNLAEPIRELRMLHRVVVLEAPQRSTPSEFDWWRQRKRPYNRSSISGREAFRALAVSLAQWSRRSRLPKGNQWAEQYYQIAISLGSHNADPEAFLELADLYVNTGKAHRLKELSKKYEKSLYRGKEAGYRKKRWDNIYKFHRALGFMYAHLRQWENPAVHYASAIFQLHHALGAADRFNRSAAPGSRIAVPPQIPALLSKAYLETGQYDNAIEIAVEYAERFLKEGHPDQSVETLKYVQGSQDPLGVRRELKQRYADLVARLPNVAPIPLAVASRTIELRRPYLEGQDIRELQKALSDHGIFIEADGMFGPMSKRALETFQRNAGLPVTGKTDDRIRGLLGID